MLVSGQPSTILRPMQNMIIRKAHGFPCPAELHAAPQNSAVLHRINFISQNIATMSSEMSQITAVAS